MTVQKSEAPAMQRQVGAAPGFMRPRLLIVDDEEAILFAMGEYFSIRGFEVDRARQKQEALALLSTHRYAAVIADLRLAGSEDVEGLAIVDAVRECWPSTVIILITAYGSPFIEAAAHARGVDVLLHKPHPLPDVVRIVLDLVAARRLQ